MRNWLKQIREIKESDDIAVRIKRTMEILKETEILLEGNALSYFENEVWYSEKNYLKKLLEYKDAKGFYRGVDCDVSWMCIVIYVQLNDRLRFEDIKLQNYCHTKYEIQSSYGRFKGDTMTSAITIIKRYLGLLWSEINQCPELLQEEKYRCFHALFDKVSSQGIPVSKKGAWLNYCKENSDVIWNALGDECKMFLKNYFMFGNYMCIPGESYKLTEKMATSFNMARSNYGKWDSIDTLLIKMYKYFETRDQKILESLFTAKQAEITKETIRWIDNFDMTNWQEFVKKNLLEDFVNEVDLKPISLKTGKSFCDTNAKYYNPIPNSIKEYNTFFKELSIRIYKRSERILKQLRNEQ